MPGSQEALNRGAMRVLAQRGAPQTPANLNAAKQVLLNNPELYATMVTRDFDERGDEQFDSARPHPAVFRDPFSQALDRAMQEPQAQTQVPVQAPTQVPNGVPAPPVIPVEEQALNPLHTQAQAVAQAPVQVPAQQAAQQVAPPTPDVVKPQPTLDDEGGDGFPFIPLPLPVGKRGEKTKRKTAQDVIDKRLDAEEPVNADRQVAKSSEAQTQTAPTRRQTGSAQGPAQGQTQTTGAQEQRPSNTQAQALQETVQEASERAGRAPAARITDRGNGQFALDFPDGRTVMARAGVVDGELFYVSGNTVYDADAYEVSPKRLTNEQLLGRLMKVIRTVR